MGKLQKRTNLTIMKRIGYEGYEKTIDMLAWKWAKRSYNTFDELKSEGNLAYVLALPQWNSSKAKKSTYLYLKIEGMIRNLACKKDPIETGKLPTINTDNPLDQLIFKEGIESLSKEAKEVVSLALHCPREIVEMSGERVGKHKIRLYLQKRGWSYYLISECFKEIKTMLT